jgi:hypothetical protein
LGGVGKTDDSAFEILDFTADGEARFRPQATDELFLFANDVEDRYGNNAGSMRVKIRRVT